jgi:hypothetical protein
MEEKWKRIDDENRDQELGGQIHQDSCMHEIKEPVGETPLIGHKIMLLYKTKLFQYKP